MRKKVFLDTSFIVALINERDQYHQAAQALSYELEQTLLITTDAVLLEIGNGLARAYRQEAIQIIDLLRNTKNVEVMAIDNQLFDDGFAVYEKFNDKQWGLVDCLSFAVMWELGVAEVLTFDDDFRQAGFVVLKAIA